MNRYNMRTLHMRFYDQFKKITEKHVHKQFGP